MNYSDKAFKKLFKTKNKNKISDKGIWIIGNMYKEQFGLEVLATDYSVLNDVDMSKWEQFYDVTPRMLQILKQKNPELEFIKLSYTKSYIVNGETGFYSDAI